MSTLLEAMNKKKELEIVVPVYNEEKQLPDSISRLVDFLNKYVEIPWGIIIANNGSSDETLEVAKSLSIQFPNIRVLDIGERGRGRALRKSWMESGADFICYTDVDLSTDIHALPEIIKTLKEGHSVVTGSRHVPGSSVKRSLVRDFFSRSYNLMLRMMLGVRFKDAQCGFKALSREAVAELVPLVENQEWFFDTELLTVAEKKGYGVVEVPVKWVEDPDSRVELHKIIPDYLGNILRLRKRLREIS
ncbi:dolichyl-phosphate beta-glucosyltransferase [Candidatus Altiarchaeota archaeon]